MSDPGPRVVLIRHGETAWSKSGQHTGRTDLALTDVGQEQARAVGAELRRRRCRFDLVLVSPRQRALRTAELAGLEGFDVVDDLQEWDYGDLEGLTTPEIQQEYPDWSIWTGPWPGGEEPAAVAARTDRVVARMLRQPSGSSVAVVAHGHILRVLAARWLGGDVTVGRWLSLGTATLCDLGWEHATPVIDIWNLRPAGL